MRSVWRYLAAVFAVMLVTASRAVTVGVDSDSVDRGEVIWSQLVLANGTTKLSMKAEAADGYVFAGWTVKDDSGQTWPSDPRFAGPLTAVVATNATVTAAFISHDEDRLGFALSDLLPSDVAYRQEVFVSLDIDSASLPTLSFRGLPSGLSYDGNTQTLSGRANEPGVFFIEAIGSNASGFGFRGFATMRVGNAAGSRLQGSDEEIPLDTYYHAEFEDLFQCSEEVASVKLTGVPPGLVWNEDWRLLYGTPTEPGDYTLKATATFASGGSETATLLLTVVAPDPSDYNVDLSILDELSVGDVIDPEENEMGTDAGGVGLVSVSGLPTGLSCEKSWEDAVRHWRLSGRLTKPGRYRIWVNVTDDSGSTQVVVRTSRQILVSDMPQQYLTVTSSDPEAGSVSGFGAITPGLPVEVTASPASGHVFAGWYDDSDLPLSLADGVDYRKPSATFIPDAGCLFMTINAVFVRSENDAAPDVSSIDGGVYYLSGTGEDFSVVFDAVSASLPRLSFSGLPDGFACVSLGDGQYELTYDAGSASRALSPGRYAVTLTAENQSKRRSSAEFVIVVPNSTDPRVRISDDYGEFSPGEAIAPISFADAVDFSRGETLSLSAIPRGLSYNASGNAKKGIVARTLTGTPTVPGYYTIVFTAKVVNSVTTNASGRIVTTYEMVKVTSSITVLPYPELIVEVDDTAAEAGCKVTGNGHFKPGTKTTLKAVAAKGWVFAGWDGLDGVEGIQTLNPKQTLISGTADAWVDAAFIPLASDYLYLDEPIVYESGFSAEWELGVDVGGTEDALLISDLIETGSFPTVKVAGLPGGVKFSASTCQLSGVPKKSGVYHVTVSAKNAGGYSFVRVFDVAVLNADGSMPIESPLPNVAGIDFSSWAELMTGVVCEPAFTALVVPRRPDTGVAVKSVKVTGLPSGIRQSTKLSADGSASVSLSGMPTNPGRFVVTVTVSYATGASAKSQQALIVEDGGSTCLQVSTESGHGTVTGGGVYASGQTVKLSATSKSGYAFAGWVAAGELEIRLSEAADLRTARLSFCMPAAELLEDSSVFGEFVSSEADREVSVAFEDTIWNITPEMSSQFGFSVSSYSLPKITYKGLPKGVKANPADGSFRYEPTDKVQPGIYHAVVSVRNSSMSRASDVGFDVFVANRVVEEIQGLDHGMNAYCQTVGVEIDPTNIVPIVPTGWKVSVKGLPSGLSFKNGAIVGTPSKAGDYTVTITAEYGSGRGKVTRVATITVRVSAFPASAVGEYSGYVDDGDDTLGTFSLSTKATGRHSVKIGLPGETLTFSGESWDSLSNGVARSRLQSRNGAMLSLSLETTSPWTEWQLTGVLDWQGESYEILAQRNPFNAKNGERAAIETLLSLVGSYKTSDGWTVKVTKTGVVSLAGKYAGKAISGSVSLHYAGDFTTRYVKFNGKKSVIVVDIDFVSGNCVISCQERHILE